MNGNGHYHNELTYAEKVQNLRDQAAGLGVNLGNTYHQKNIAAARARSKQIAVNENAHPVSPIYSFLRNAIRYVGNLIVMLVILLILFFLLPVTIFGLSYAEIQRVSLGVSLFDPPRAMLMSVVAVSAYVVLLVVQSNMVFNQPDYTRSVWSIRIWIGDLLYLLGIGKNWQIRTLTRQQMLEHAIKWIGSIIIILGTVGSLSNRLEQFHGPWYIALVNIFTDSDLLTFISLIGGTAYTAGLLAGLHFIIHLTYSQYVFIMPDQAEDFLAEYGDYSEAQDQAEILYLQSIISREKMKREQQS